MEEISLPPILPAKLIKSWDVYTINKIPISSIDLMERAARVFCTWFTTEYSDLNTKIIIVAGNGNNGGDGLAIARILIFSGYTVLLFIDTNSKNSSPDRTINLHRLPNNDGLVIHSIDQLNEILESISVEGTIVIDAIFGTGISQPIRAPWDSVVSNLNKFKVKYKLISIDLPSGLPADTIAQWPCIEADLTFCFETPKLSLLCPENAPYSNGFVYESIGLEKEFLETIEVDRFFLNHAFVSGKLAKRNKFDHKGTNGAVFQYCGSTNMPGAAVLSVLSAFRSGAGYVYLFHPNIISSILLTICPEAIIIENADIPSKANVLLAGCGIGKSSDAIDSLKMLLDSCLLPIVLDADALNILAEHPNMLEALPSNTILTPHPGEFDRLFGKHNSNLDRWTTQKTYSKSKGFIIVLKGAHTSISDPCGNLYFNSTGNPILAKAGSGDVLSGIIAAFLAQGSSPLDAALCGVYIHGLAADIAAKSVHERSLMAAELTTYISDALKSF